MPAIIEFCGAVDEAKLNQVIEHFNEYGESGELGDVFFKKEGYPFK